MSKTSKSNWSQIVTTSNKEEISTQIITTNEIEDKILNIRNLQVMIDRDLAELYGVETRVLNQAVKRNIERFPESFRFQLNSNEKDKVITNCDNLRDLRFSPTNPYVFTEQGVAMLSSVLKSQTAIEVSIKIMNAFVEMRKFILTNAQVFQRLDNLEIKQLGNDDKFERFGEEMFFFYQNGRRRIDWRIIK